MQTDRLSIWNDQNWLLSGRSFDENLGSGVLYDLPLKATLIPMPSLKCQPLRSARANMWPSSGSSPLILTPGNSAHASGATEGLEVRAFDTCFTNSGLKDIDHLPACMMCLMWDKSISFVPPSTHMFSVEVHFNEVLLCRNTDLIQAMVNAKDFCDPKVAVSLLLLSCTSFASTTAVILTHCKDCSARRPSISWPHNVARKPRHNCPTSSDSSHPNVSAA